MEFRSKPADQVLEELKQQTSRYGIDGYDVVDNILDMKYFGSLFPRLSAAGGPYRLFYEVKSNLKRSQVRQLREAGVTHIQPGIESLHSQVLALMKKGCEAWQNVQLLKWCSEFGIRAYWNMLFDFPGERDEWYDEMATRLPLLFHLQPPQGGSLASVVFHRYSPYHTQQSEFGLELRPNRFYEFVYPLSRGDLRDQVYYFEDSGPNASQFSPVGALAPNRPGAFRVQHILHQWNTAFWSDHRPQLTMDVEDDRIQIRDTRTCALDEVVVLEGIERDVFLFFDDAPSPARCLRQLTREQGYSTLEVESVIESLKERKLLLDVDGRLVGLAVRVNNAQLSTDAQYPGGYVECRTKSPVAPRLEQESTAVT